MVCFAPSVLDILSAAWCYENANQYKPPARFIGLATSSLSTLDSFSLRLPCRDHRQYGYGT